MIRLVNLHKYFGPVKVLNGVDLVIEDGKTTTVLGLSGSGKSTILKHIVGLMHPTKGEIYVGDTEVTRLRGAALDKIRLKFGVVFQNADVILNFGDLMILGMAFPNIAGVVMMAKLVKADLDRYLSRLAAGEFQVYS